MLNIIDAIIIIFILLGGVVGFKNGAIKEGTKFLGLFAIIIISFLLKDRLMIILYENLPFFDFFGLIRGLTSVNILFYQLVSFLVIFAGLYFVLKVLIVITGLIEWLLKLTIFLSIPSKIAGIFVGLIEHYVYVFIILYVVAMPIFNFKLVTESILANPILEKTPVLSSMIDNTVLVYTDVWNVIKNKENKTNKEINTLVLATLLDNNLITIESAKKLVLSNKIIIEDPSILDNYEQNGDLYDKLKEVFEKREELY